MKRELLNTYSTPACKVFLINLSRIIMDSNIEGGDNPEDPDDELG